MSADNDTIRVTDPDAGSRQQASPAAATHSQTAAESGTAPSAPKKAGALRRFVRSVVSHAVVAALAAGLFFTYHKQILGYAADRVCAENALGSFRSGSTRAAARHGPEAKSAAATAASPAAQKQSVPAQPVMPEPGTQAAPAKQIAAKTLPAGETPLTVRTPEPAAVPVAQAKMPAPAATVPTPAADVPAPTNVPAAAPAQTDPPPATITKTAKVQPPAEAAPPPVAPSSPSAARVSVPATSPVGASVETGRLASLWTAARKAYAAGSPDAVAAYQNLIKGWPDVADLPGELGNIYYATGKMREAAAAYYEAGLRHLRRGEAGRAACVANILGALDLQLAGQLGQLANTPCPASSQRR